MRQTITKEFQWDCAHRLWNPNKTDEENKKLFGLCYNIHGHTYKMFVSISSEILVDGMVINFKDLKYIVKKNIVDEYDHCLHLTHGDPLYQTLKKSDIRITLSPDETTCENQIIQFWIVLEKALLPYRLEEIKLYETPTSCATLTR